MSYIDLEDLDLIEADEHELLVEEDNLLPNDDGNGENQNDNNAGNDDAGNKDATKVAPKKRISKNVQPKLNYDRLNGPRGLLVLESCFKDIQFKGKGHEKEDLLAVMTRLEQWAHRLFPKFTFDDTLRKLEQLGRKNQVSNFVKRIRLDMIDDSHSFEPNDIVVDQDEPEVDPFDRLVEINPPSSSTQLDRNPRNQQSTLTDEQRERMIRNRLLAEERRLMRMKAKKKELAHEQQSELELKERSEQHTQDEEQRQKHSENAGHYHNQLTDSNQTLSTQLSSNEDGSQPHFGILNLSENQEKPHNEQPEYQELDNLPT